MTKFEAKQWLSTLSLHLVFIVPTHIWFSLLNEWVLKLGFKFNRKLLDKQQSCTRWTGASTSYAWLQCWTTESEIRSILFQLDPKKIPKLRLYTFLTLVTAVSIEISQKSRISDSKIFFWQFLVKVYSFRFIYKMMLAAIPISLLPCPILI